VSTVIDEPGQPSDDAGEPVRDGDELPPDDETPSGDDQESFVVRNKTRVLQQVDGAGRWVSDRRPVSVPIDILVRFYERDRDSFGSVLGSALAFRLFLFLVPLLLLALGLASLLVGQDLVSDDPTKAIGISGAMAGEVEESLHAHTTTSWLLIASGLFGTVWAGRGLAKVLTAISARSWELEASLSKASLRVAGSVTGLLTLVVVVSSVINRIREAAGVAVAGISLVGVLAIYTAMWFVLTLSLPRATPDPGSVLPGAALVGLTVTALQWFGQFYLPERIGSKSQVLGGLGVTVVALGWLFILARVMAASLVLNAVVYERLGSISELVFGLPVVRRIPRRYPKVARFFDLEVGAATTTTESDSVAEGKGESDD
jgi:uncharacterized BrkB/YihY/UPF0761 family membrane protein